MKQTIKATPRPWEAFNQYVWTKKKENIANCSVVQEGSKITASESYANAELIVRAVNSHDALVELAKSIIDLMEHPDTNEKLKDIPFLIRASVRARKALALAEGGKT